VQSDAGSKIAVEIKRIAETIASGAIPVQENTSPRPAFWTSLFKRHPAHNALELQVSSTDLSM
jgi:hypothetical protein